MMSCNDIVNPLDVKPCETLLSLIYIYTASANGGRFYLIIFDA